MAANPAEALPLIAPAMGEPIDFTGFGALQSRSSRLLSSLRRKVRSPEDLKVAPMYNSTELAALCGLDIQQLNYLHRSNEALPRGIESGQGRRREFTLAEARTWVRLAAKPSPPLARPPGAKGKVIAVANFKGGSSKTTIAVHLAQALSLRRARKVLLVDLDSQASTTILMDVKAESEVTGDQTVVPLIFGEQQDLRYAVRPTYWDGVDLIPSTFDVYGCEVHLPVRTAQDRAFEFWPLLRQGLEPLLDEYDVVVLDCPPSLSYLTFNAVYAADGLLVPIPPDALDFASSVMLWELLVDLFDVTSKRAKTLGKTFEKQFDFINVLISKAGSSDSAEAIRRLIYEAYGAHVLDVQIPMSESAKKSSFELGSVYDTKRGADMRAIKRIREQTDRLADRIDQQLVANWYGKRQ